MKRTTYIIVGMLLAGLLIMCGSMFYMATISIGWKDSIMTIGGEPKTISLPPCHTIRLSALENVTRVRKGVSEIEQAIFMGEVPLTVTSGDSTGGSLTMAADMEQFVRLNVASDTLQVVFDFSKEKQKERFRDKKILNIASSNMILVLPAEVQNIISVAKGMNVTFDNLCCDSLSFNVSDAAQIENSRITSLNARAGSLYFKSGMVDNLYLNLDRVYNWKVNTDSFHIDTEHLTASKEQWCNLQEGECRRLLWTPLTSKASLNMKLKQAVKIEVVE